MEYHKARSLCFIFYAVWSSCVSSAQNDCGGLFTSLDGTIQSPAYPENYPPNQDCVYRIIQPEEYRITLTFDTFDLQGDLRTGSNACPFDFVQIRDGDSENAPRLLHACGSKPNTTSMTERSFKNAMWIRFVSDGSESGAGFHANYTSEILQDKFLLSPVTGRHIVRVDLETLSFATIPNLELFHPFAVDYDPVDKRVFWTDLHTQGIFSANLDGTFSGTVKILNSNAKPTGIAFDPLSRLVFYTDAGNDVIAMVAASGSWERTIISENLDKPLAIVVDTMNGVLFWTDRGTPEKIERANYDGTERKILHDTYLFLPDALALDLPNNRLFWVNQRMDNGFVESSDLDGNNRQQLYSLDVGKHWLFGLAFYHDQFYVTDWTPKRADTNESRILRLNADGSGGKVMLTFTSRLNDIHVVAEDSWERGPNGCGSNNGNCTHICVPAAGNTSKCLCPDQATDCFPTGTCKPGFYGPNCDQPCPLHCENDRCDPEHGVCYTCNPGYWGVTCDYSCHTTHCWNDRCEQTSGQCASACMAGYWGAFCDLRCPENCRDEFCDKESGSCPACVGHFELPECRECLPSYYGAHCEKRCLSAMCKHGRCDRDTGLCSECEGDESPPHCSACGSGTYGPDCSSECGHCVEGSTCNAETGECPAGCQGGWQGSRCDQESYVEADSKTGVNIPLIVGVTVGGVVLLVVVIILLVALYRYGNRRSSDREPLAVGYMSAP